MRHTKITIATIVIAGAAAAAGVGIASASGGTPSYSPRIDPSAPSPAAHPAAGTSDIHVVMATVKGKTEPILVDAHGDPLYTFKADTPTATHVRGQLAALWPPLVSHSPTADGASGRLTVVSTPNGSQVAYNGHFLYTFVDDTPGDVTGQGVQNFFVATPDTGSSGSTPASSGSAPSNGYGY